MKSNPNKAVPYTSVEVAAKIEAQRLVDEKIPEGSFEVFDGKHTTRYWITNLNHPDNRSIRSTDKRFKTGTGVTNVFLHDQSKRLQLQAAA